MANGWLPFSSVFHLWKNARNYYTLLTRRSTPVYIKALAVAAVVYLLSPYDLVPDWLAGLGIVDDIAVITLAFSVISRLLKRREKNAKDQDVK